MLQLAYRIMKELLSVTATWNDKKKMITDGRRKGFLFILN